MRITSKLSVFISIMLVLLFLLYSPMEVYCSEKEQDELLTLFQAAVTAPETEIESIQNELGVYFVDDPETFIHLLSLESKDVRDKVVQLLIWEAKYWYYACNLPGFMEGVYSLQLDADANEAAHEILRTLEAAVEEIWGIPNPKTADPVGAVAAAMVLSGLGCCMMLRRKRRVNAPM